MIETILTIVRRPVRLLSESFSSGTRQTVLLGKRLRGNLPRKHSSQARAHDPQHPSMLPLVQIVLGCPLNEQEKPSTVDRVA